MPKSSSPTPDQHRLAREAAKIFLRLSENPDDPKAILDRNTFLARGDAERRTYAKMARTWKATRQHDRSRKVKTVAIVGVVVASAYFLYEPLRLQISADVQSALSAERAMLISGDIAELDASTALIDRTNGDERRVVLLAGAAFFDVETDARPFIVQVDDLQAKAIGTAFEVAQSDDDIFVTVSKGLVEVRAENVTWQVTPGQRLYWSGDGQPEIDSIKSESIATWRKDRLVTDGMTFGQVAAVIERRLQGKILILDNKLANSFVSGGLDLTNPHQALRTLSATRGATVLVLPSLLTVILSAS